MRVRRALCLVWLAAVLASGAGCAAPERRAVDAGFTRTVVPTLEFDLVTWHRGLGQPTRALHVYIEGDGRAFVRGRVSRDPTPRQALALELARRDDSSAVLYLARPCQYLDGQTLARCHPKYWSTHRFADEVIAAASSAVDWALAHWTSPPPVAVVGYSGGGSVAVLLSARRRDVVGLVTVAANLDHAAWTRFHDVPPLEGSLNPVTLPARALAGVPQLHLAGDRDDVVPPHVVGRFVRSHALAPESFRVIAGYSHRCCWADLWPQPLCGLSRAVVCTGR
jgi:pimeloyl-ACP methyl ester carboxylesterase